MARGKAARRKSRAFCRAPPTCRCHSYTTRPRHHRPRAQRLSKPATSMTSRPSTLSGIGNRQPPPPRSLRSYGRHRDPLMAWYRFAFLFAFPPFRQLQVFSRAPEVAWYRYPGVCRYLHVRCTIALRHDCIITQQRFLQSVPNARMSTVAGYAPPKAQRSRPMRGA